MRYSKWTIVEKLKGGKCIAKCDCGTIKEQWFSNIKSGKSTQCASCQGIGYRGSGIHGDIGGVKHPLYNVWSGIKRRCYNPQQKSYKYYGAKGVTMCKEWKSDYRSFYEWMIENGYTKGMVCSRKGDIGNYEPANCVVKTFSENSKEVDMSSVSTPESKIRQSRRLSSLKGEDYDDCLLDCLSGKHKAFELENKWKVDRHTLLRMCRLQGKEPQWRKTRLNEEQIEEVVGLRNQGFTNKEIGLKFGMSHEGIRMILKDNDGSDK